MKARWRSWSLVAAGVAAGLLLCTSRAEAWNFREHMELGREGHAAACQQLAHELSLQDSGEACESATRPEQVRWCLACKVYSPGLYGQAVAIAGDRVGTPEELMSIAGERTATSLSAYAFLALVNTAHFQPHAPRNWRTHHERALELAAGQKGGQQLAQDFAKAFYTSAFADHFLQDAFSAGHAGFNRVSSSAAASKAYHDIWNNSGRLVAAPNGQCWIQYGDNKLHAASVVARESLRRAETASIYDVLATFVTQRRDPARELRPLYFMPKAMSRDPLPESVFVNEGGGAGSPVQSTTFINRLYYAQKDQERACAAATVAIEGMSNAAELSFGIDFWARARVEEQAWTATVDATATHLLESGWLSVEGGLSAGVDRREGQAAFAPGAVGGVLSPPLYLAHGLWRNELGAQAVGLLRFGGGRRADAYGAAFWRTSLEIADKIWRLQVGATYDPVTERVGGMAAIGVEPARWRRVRGGGSLGN
jgi:hypothetical protein